MDHEATRTANPASQAPDPKGPRHSLNTTVLKLRDDERGMSHDWSIRDSVEGLQVFGSTGSGKTSGSGRAVALGLLKAGFGGLVLTAKPSDGWDWYRGAGHPDGPGYLALAGRPDRPIVVGPLHRTREYRDAGVEVPEGGHRFNVIQHEYQRLLGLGVNPTFNLTVMLAAGLGAIGERGSHEPYWDEALKQMLANAIQLCAMADGSVSLPVLYRTVLDGPRTAARARSRSWQRSSECWRRLELAERAMLDKRLDPLTQDDFEHTSRYWLKDFASLSDRTRSIVVSLFTSKVDGLLRSPLRAMFCSPGQPTGCEPSKTHAGRVVIVDLPVKAFGEVGRFAQVLFKTAWQLHTEDRPIAVHQGSGEIRGGAPVFLWADESQYFVTERDMLFQQTARSKVAATVYLTQNISNYYAAVAGRSGHAPVDSLLGNLQTKVFHANGDPATNEWGARLFSRGAVERGNRSQSIGFSEVSASRGSSQHVEDLVLPSVFTTLRKGGPSGSVDAVVFQAGRSWGDDLDDRRHVLRTSFEQR